MIDDFKPVPERQPARLDSDRELKTQSEDDGTADKKSQAPQEEYILPRADKVVRPAPDFRTPEQVAAMEASSGAQPGEDDNELLLPALASSDKPVKPTKHGKTITLFRRWTVSRRKLIALSAAMVLLIGGGTVFALQHFKPAPAKPVAVKATAAPKPKPKPIVSPLTGMPVTAEQRDRPVTGVMIENSPDARPQSGLKDAGVVYEAIAEAGITRFLALYQESQPPNVGPIRSSRPYYLDWAMAFDASYAHVGGSPDALQRIKDIGIKDMDQFFNPTAYHRVSTRYAPHNMYSSLAQLLELGQSKGYDKSTFTSFVRKAEQPYKAPAAAAPGSPAPKTVAGQNVHQDSRSAASSINFAISGAYYNVHYDYDAAANSYKRSEGGAPHMDAESNTQLVPKVVIALVMPYGLMADGYHSQYTTQGSGKMFVFQDGTVTTGTWSKGEPKSQFVFKDDAGKDLALNPGPTWLTALGDAGQVNYQ